MFLSFYVLLMRLLPRPTLFPYTTLFRSALPVDEVPGLLGEPGDDGGARDIARGVPAHAIGDREDRCGGQQRSEEHTSELQSRGHLVCRLLLEKKKGWRRR